MKLSTRERWLLALLFPVAVFVLWRELLDAPIAGRIVKAETRLDTATGGGETAQEAGRVRARCEGLEQELADLQDEERALAARRTGLLARWTRGARRTEAVRAVLELFRARSIELASSGPESDEETSSRLAPELRALAREMQALGAEAPRLWRFELRGAYAPMVAALEACAGLEVFALPIALSARPSSTGARELAFVLWLWI